MTNDELLLAVSDMMDKKLDAKLNPLENNLRSVKDEVQSVKDEVRSVKNEVRQLKLFQEGVIMPRLQNIESCYVDTYKRYQAGSEQIEAMQVDIDVMKSVIQEHSGILQKMA